MRRHAKAATEGSRDYGHSDRCQSSLTGASARVILSLVSLLLALAFSAQPAFAGTGSGRQFLFSFDGSSAGAGSFQRVESIDVDQASGAVYVTSEFEGKPGLAKFHPDGTAWNFAATGTPVLFGTGAQAFGTTQRGLYVAVDNTGGPNDGQILVAETAGRHLYAFDPSGNLLWSTSLSGASNMFVFDVAVDNSGHPWVLDLNSGLYEFANTGSPPEQIAHQTPGGVPFKLEFDANGNGYVGDASNTLDRYAGGDFTQSPTAFDSDAVGSYADRSSPAGHIFTLGTTAQEYEPNGSLIASFGEGYYTPPNSGGAEGILAYDSNLNRVYVGQLGDQPENSVVEAFGPPLPSATVPDATVEAATGVTVSRATLHGKVNPQGVPNSYHFEWKVGAESSWATAKSSPPVSLPEDSLEHPVEFQATGLSGNKTYQFRLVTENSAGGQHGFSSAESFSTETAPGAPSATIDSATATGPTSAHLAATIDTQGDTTTWLVQISTDPACVEGFSDRSTHTIPSEETGPVSVAETVTGLLPAEHYCVRVQATNSAGTSTSEVAEFTTEAVTPTAVDTAFAAPRTDTTARLNGYVNPEGAPVSYGFEYRRAGDSSWTQLPPQESSLETRVQSMVDYELAGLSADTEYEFRFHAEDEAGEATPGAVRTFKTRTSAEVADPGRGFEMVSNPDKGNQNAIVSHSAETAVSPNGSRVLWEVAGGAPGGNNGAFNYFLAERTPNGWQSRAIAPPSADQFDEGRLSYVVEADTPDLSRFVVSIGEFLPFFGLQGPHEVALLDDHQHQTLLAHYSRPHQGSEVSEDGRSHVLVVPYETKELEDIASGTPEVVSIMPDGQPSECGVEAFDRFIPTTYHQMNVHDASLVYFAAYANGECGSPGSPIRRGIYLRDRLTGETIQVDPGTPGAREDSQIIRATPDGRSVYFTTFTALDPADGNTTNDVYRWDMESEEATCLTCVVPSAEVGVDASSRVLVSDDFSQIYFESPARLVANRGTTDETNIYRLHDGALHYVATFESGEPPLERDRSKLSADGRTLLLKGTPVPFTTTADSVGACNPGTLLASCPEVYVYEADNGSLECASCRSGGQTVARGELTPPGEGTPPSFSQDGSTAAFITKEPLVRADVNNDYDVYEWRKGVVRLVTDGVSTRGSLQAAIRPGAISANGSDIVFSMAQPGLTGFEQDGAAAVYDARIGGGFPVPSPAAHCDGEACQKPLTAPPAGAPATSAGFSGPGSSRSARKSRHRCGRKGHAKHAKRRCHRRHHKRHKSHKSHRRAGAHR